MEINKLVKIYWKDAASSEAWEDLNEVRDWASKTYVTPCETVGELILDTDDYVVVAASNNGEKTLYGDKVLIPKTLIDKTEEL